jgi:hypothetical protein
LQGDKRFRVVPEREKARLVLEVVSRGATSSNGGGAVGMPIGTSTFLISERHDRDLYVLHVRTNEKPIIFQTRRHGAAAPDSSL